MILKKIKSTLCLLWITKFKLTEKQPLPKPPKLSVTKKFEM